MRSVYLDYNATTPLDPAIRTAMLPFLEDNFANPSSIHGPGRRARAALDDARDRVAHVFACKPSEIVFTSGGTESVNLAILGTARAMRHKGRHLVASPIEHHAVLHACRYLEQKEGFEITLVPVDSEGRIDPEQFASLLRPETVLASVMAANNETGVVQPVATLAERCRQRGVLFHTDAVQWLGKMPLNTIHDFGADLVSFCAHKIHGPKGAGGLFIRSPFKPDPILFGGSHEGELRAGTENVAGILGLALALELFVRTPVFASPAVFSLARHLREFLGSISDVSVFSNPDRGLPNTLAFAARGCDQLDLLAMLDLEGFLASGGAACSSGALEPSHVIRALGHSQDVASGLIRFSLGRESSRPDIERLCVILPRLVAQLRGSE